jgi:hypothetical protein
VLNGNFGEVYCLKRNHRVVSRIFKRIEECNGRGFSLKGAVTLKTIVVYVFYDHPTAFAGSEIWNDRLGLIEAERGIFGELQASVGGRELYLKDRRWPASRMAISGAKLTATGIGPGRGDGSYIGLAGLRTGQIRGLQYIFVLFGWRVLSLTSRPWGHRPQLRAEIDWRTYKHERLVKNCKDEFVVSDIAIVSYKRLQLWRLPMNATKSHGTKRFRKSLVPKTLHYKGERYEVKRHDPAKGVYVLRSKTNPSEEIEVLTLDYFPNSSASGK